MLSNELMGLLALSILWVNTLLIAAAAWKEIAALSVWRRRFALLDGDEGAGLVRARVTEGAGPGGALAVQRVEQVGRAATQDDGGRRVILFADRSAAGEIFGGVVAREGSGAAISVDAEANAEVWMPAAALEARGACASDEAFDRAYESARKARGFARAVEGAATGEVFLFGQLRPMGKGLALSPAKSGAARGHLRSAPVGRAQDQARGALHHRRYRRRRRVHGSGAVAPRFGVVSTLGGAACLGFFLIVQPAGTALRDAVRLPSRASLRGRWRRSAPVQEPSAPPDAERAQ